MIFKCDYLDKAALLDGKLIIIPQQIMIYLLENTI